MSHGLSADTRNSFRVRACDNCRLAQGPTSPNFGPVLARPITAPQTAPTFEGQSSFHHQSLLAKDAVFTAVGSAQSGRLDDNVSAALSSLKDSLNRHQEPSSQRPPEPEFSTEDLLPVDLVVAIVKRVKAQPPFFLVSQAWRDYQQLESLCQSVYFPLQPVAAGSLSLLHGLLYYIIRDYMHEKPADLAHYDLSPSAAFCERKLSSFLQSNETIVNPTLEKLQTLLIGVIKSQEESDLQRCWTYLSLAFNMCQSMGLHRSYTLTNDNFSVAESKQHVFWSLYTIDKNISLNLGLASHFPDHDIDADLITPSTDPKHRPWDIMSLVIVEFAGIQGRVYDELYSIAASKASDEQRWAAIDKLSSDMIVVRNKLLAIDVSQGLYAESLHGMAACADFVTYSVLTVIYRAQSRPRDATAISSQCYETATLALHSHLKCFTYFRDRQTHKQTEYVNSILLYPSFVPFVIVFLHAITSSSSSDLALLQDTVRSLDLVKGLSSGSMHLYSICEAFAKTAQVLVGTQQTLTGLEENQDGSLIMPPSFDGSTNIALPDVFWPEDMLDSSMNQEEISTFLNDFIGTNRSVMDILNSNHSSELPL
ncbi:C6 transcription factor [Penicillium argentinense]|uniref:C6 transcription factor n=1 Tax=Penicillium argentinense TaxID=1131581 RepID=A0A9W9ENL1_9EURO|nr:C6 transcription factor [Penicillium argentinense]KAJ5085024.1 C6 transcription factor [Penicillium argentinense]